MEKRCNGCMRIKGSELQCGFCGYLETDQNSCHQLPVGTILHDQYRLGRVLGQGGFGITYLGWDEKLEIPVAIKEYYPSHHVSRTQDSAVVVTTNDNAQAYQDGKDRFLREARTLARLHNQFHIVQVHNFFSENNTAYIVMEYVEGVTLKEHIRRQGGKLSAQETFAIMQPIFQVMQKVHHAGMIHRDISPDNIMLQPDGSVKILDFGTARDMEGGQLTHSTQAVLKRGFAPPEQYTSGREIDQRADEYALCCTIYYCLTGKRPLDALNRLMDRSSIAWKEIPGLTKGQIAALEKGTALMAEDRFPDMTALGNALFSDNVPQPAAPKAEKPKKKAAKAPPPPPKRKEESTILLKEKDVTKPRRKLWPVLALMAVLLAAAGFLGIQASSRETQYENAQELLEQRHFDDAYAAFEKLGDYEDSQEMMIEVRYQQAQFFLWFQYYDDAYAAFEALGEYKDSREMLTEVQYQKAAVMQYNKEYLEAYQLFQSLGDYNDSASRARSILSDLIQPQTLAPGMNHTLGLKANGGVVTVGYNEYGRCDVYGWSGIASVAAGAYHSVGLRKDGTVVAAGSNTLGQCDVYSWDEVIAIAAGLNHTVGLKADGTVVATGDNAFGQCDVSGWENIVAIAAGTYHTVGITADGRVVAVGDNRYGQCDVSSWRNITQVSAGESHTVGLKTDGTVEAVGSNKLYQCSVYGWSGITAISAGKDQTAGLKADGTLVIVGSNEKGCTEVRDWKDIETVVLGWNQTLGLRADGTVISAGEKSGQWEIDSWTGIRVPKGE